MSLPLASAAMASPHCNKPSAPIIVPQALTALHEMAATYDAFLVDLWGVTHNGTTPYAGAIAALRDLRAQGKKVVFVSNSSSLQPQVAQQLASMGVTEYDALITSGDLVAAALHTEPRLWRPGYAGCAVLVGDQAVFARYAAPVRLQRVAAEAGLVVNCWYDYRRQTPASLAPQLAEWLVHGLPMLCANPDKEVELADGRLLCPGALAAAYEAIGGVVHYYGKPYAPIYHAARQALEALGCHSQRLAMIGDNLHTDVRGGQGAGIDTILVTSGVHRAALGVRWGEAATPDALARLWAQEGYTPNYTIPALRY